MTVGSALAGGVCNALAVLVLLGCGPREKPPEPAKLPAAAEKQVTQFFPANHPNYRKDDGGVDVRTVMAAHNEARARHGVRPLSWSPELARSAEEWARQCRWGHSGAPGKGENLSRWSGPFTQREMVDIWYDEIADYNFRSGKAKRRGAVVGHFTQMVWADTREIGCGYASCPRVGEYLVCQYLPAGNVLTKFVQNVPPPVR